MAHPRAIVVVCGLLAGCAALSNSSHPTIRNTEQASLTPDAATSSNTPLLLSNAANTDNSAAPLASASASAKRNPNACAPPDEGWGQYQPFQSLGKARFTLPQKEYYNGEPLDVIIHFHMADAIRRTVVQSGIQVVLVGLDVGEGSKKYTKEFEDPNAFLNLQNKIKQAVTENLGPEAKTKRWVLSSWSAGFGATTAIIKKHAPIIDGVILLDSLYGPYAAGPEGEPNGILLTPPLDPMVNYARRAKKGESFFFLSHSAIVTKGYANTGEVATHIAKTLQERPVAVPRGDDIRGLVGYIDSGEFHMRSFAGTDPKAHCNHLVYIGEAIKYWAER